MGSTRIFSKTIGQKNNFMIAEINVVATTKMKQLKSLLLGKMLFNFDEQIVAGSVMISIFKDKNLPLQTYSSIGTKVKPYYINYGLLTSREYINQAINTIMKEFNAQTEIKEMFILLSFNHIVWAVDIKPNLELHNGEPIVDYPSLIRYHDED